jgi:hypothetical protein
MYQYKFNGAGEPIATLVSDIQQEEYRIFGSGDAVDWTSKYYDGTDLQDKIYNYSIGIDGTATFVNKGMPLSDCIHSAAQIDIGGKIYLNGAWTDRPAVLQDLAQLKLQKCADIRMKITSTDYDCLKYVDGALTEEQYASTKAKRAALRLAFNDVETATTVDAVNAISY